MKLNSQQTAFLITTNVITTPNFMNCELLLQVSYEHKATQCQGNRNKFIYFYIGSNSYMML